MPEANQENPLRPQKYRDAEAELGGADDVEKTTYVTGRGTDPRARKGDGPAATVSARGPGTWVTLVIVTLVVLVALAYLIGIGR